MLLSETQSKQNRTRQSFEWGPEMTICFYVLGYVGVASGLLIASFTVCLHLYRLYLKEPCIREVSTGMRAAPYRWVSLHQSLSLHMYSPSTSENNSHPNYTILNISLEDAGYSELVPRAIIKNVMSGFREWQCGAFIMVQKN